MMQSFVDEKYFIHFFECLLNTQRFSIEARQREAILDFFKGKTDLYLDTNFKSIFDNFDNPTLAVLSPIINQFTTGKRGTNILQNQNEKFTSLGRINVYNEIDHPFCSFWLGKRYRYSIDKYADNNPYYFLSSDDDLVKWKSFSKSKTYYVGSGTHPNSDDVLNSWDEIEIFAHSFNDIIINDHFSFQDKTGIEENIIPMISGLSAAKNKIENVLIFTEKNKILNNSLEDTHKLIKESLRKINLEPNIKIYLSYKAPHGRYTITNNLFIEFGNSMDFFDKEKNLKSRGKLNDSSVRIMPIFNVNRSQLKSVLSWLKDISLNTEDCMSYGTRTNNMLDLI